jgi:hypothetical protein
VRTLLMGILLAGAAANVAAGGDVGRIVVSAPAPQKHCRLGHWLRRAAGAEPVLAQRLSSWGIAGARPAKTADARKPHRRQRVARLEERSAR